MAVIDLKTEASKSELQWFGLLFGLFFGLIGGLAWWRWEAQNVAYGIWSVAGVITVLYYLIPPMRKPLFFGWMYAAYPIGWVISHVILLTIYYVVLTPIGLFMRALGHDPLQKKLKPKADTHWIRREPTKDPGRYFHQY